MAVREILPEELADVIAENGKVFVDCFATWCMPCAMMSPIFEEVSEDESLSDVTFVKIQLDDDETIVVKYFVRSVPTFLYFEDRELKDRIIGSVSAEELRKYIKDKL